MKFFTKERLKENWEWLIIIIIIGILLLVLAGFVTVTAINTDYCQRWFSKPASKINIGDIVFIVVLHAWMNRTTVNTKN